MNRIQANVRMLWNDFRTSYLIFWSVLLAIFALMIILFLVKFGEDGTVQIGGGMTAVWVYFFVAGALQPNSTFRFALGMSVTRREYFAATDVFWLLMAALTGVIVLIGHVLERAFFQNIAGMNITFFTMLEDTAMWDVLLIGFAVPLFCAAAGFLAASGTYRIGHIAWIGSIGLGLLAVMTIHLLELWDEIARLFSQIETAGEAAIWLVILSAILFLFSWLILCRAPVKTGR